MKSLVALAVAGAFLVGTAVGITENPNRSAVQAQEIKPTEELLGEVTVDMGPGSPNHELFVEARRDDADRAKLKAMENKGAWN